MAKTRTRREPWTEPSGEEGEQPRTGPSPTEQEGVTRYPEPHDHGGAYNRSPCAHLPHVRGGRRPVKPSESRTGACPLL